MGSIVAFLRVLDVDFFIYISWSGGWSFRDFERGLYFLLSARKK